MFQVREHQVGEPPVLSVLLWQRAFDPQAGSWSLPGGGLQDNEDLKSSALRQLAEKGLKLGDGAAVEAKLHELRMKYEPYVMGIARNLYIPVPQWVRHDNIKDNWQSGPWDRMIQAQGLGRLSRERPSGEKTVIIEEHF